MKTLKILLVVLCFSGLTRTNGQIVTGMASSAVIGGVKWAIGHPSEIKWFLTGMSHTWWYCQYQDGFTTYNDFRSYRTATDAWNYFVQGNGDCDAIYKDWNGNWNHICYQSPIQAQNYTRQHGQIIDIGFQRNDGTNHSLLNY